VQRKMQDEIDRVLGDRPLPSYAAEKHSEERV
jgi:hypothetical protein